ncbi:MAG TPA: hypothetical protein VGO62_00550, partial [Myxococcota bacterium]
YRIQDRTGAMSDVECDMDPAHDGGGWTVIGRSDASHCPDGWDLGIGGCTIGVFSGAVSEAHFLVPLASFSDVRGDVTAFALGPNNAFSGDHDTIDDVYVDGLSVTASEPRVHVWTFAAGFPGVSDNVAALDGACPCAAGAQPSPFVQRDYACQSPTVANQAALWDGDSCGDDVGAGSFEHVGIDAAARTAATLDARLLSKSHLLGIPSGLLYVTSFVLEVR